MKKQHERVWGPAEDGQLLALHSLGISARQAAQRMGWSASAVSRRARVLGIGWDRTKVLAATVARKRDIQSMKAEQAYSAMEQAAEVLACFGKPFLAFNFGGKDNDYNEHLLDGPPTADMRNLAQTWSLLIKGAAELQATAVDDAEDAKSLLLQLATALQIEESPVLAEDMATAE